MIIGASPSLSHGGRLAGQLSVLLYFPEHAFEQSEQSTGVGTTGSLMPDH
jgi:hypothetical protein